MNSKSYIFKLTILIFLGTLSASFSQQIDDTCSLNLKFYENQYNRGEFETVDSALRSCLESANLTFTQKKDYYRLLAMNSIAFDNIPLAESDIKELLKIDQNYKIRSDDPFVFQVLLNQLRFSNAKFVTSVSKISENINEAPANIILLTKEEIKQRGYKDLEEVFHDMPGFDVSKTSGGTYSSIYQRGYRTGNNNDRSLILVDGIEDNDIWSNNIWLSRQYSLSNIKQFEVIHGPASTMYGANAFGGVYNILTLTPSDMIPSFDENFGFNGFFGTGSYNTKEADFTMAFRKNKLSATVTARIHTSDEYDRSGYSDFDFDYGLNELTSYQALRMTYNSAIGSEHYTTQVDSDGDGAIDYVQYNAEGAILARNLDNLGYNFDQPNGKIKYSNESINKYVQAKIYYGDFTLGVQHWSNEEGLAWFNDLYFSGTNNGTKWQPTQNTAYLKYDKNISSKLNITNIASYKFHELGKNTGLSSVPTLYYQAENGTTGLSNSNYSALESSAYLDMNYLNGSSAVSKYATEASLLGHSALPNWNYRRYILSSNQTRNELKVTYNGDLLKVVTGLEGRYSEVQENYTFNDDDTAIEHNIIDVGFYAQGNYTYRKLKAVIGGRVDYNRIDDDGGFGFVFNPRFALVYPIKKFVIKGIYSEAFKDATNFDKYSISAGSRDIPNPTLPPEKVNTTEFSILWDNSTELKNKFKVFAELSAFSSKFSGAIQTVQTASGLQNQDVGSLEIKGGQFRTNLSYSNLDLELNYTYTDPFSIAYDSDANSFSDPVRVGDIATHKGNVILNWKFKTRDAENSAVFNWNNRLNISEARKTGAGTTVSGNPYDSIKGFSILNSYLSFETKAGLIFGIGINNALDTEWFVPGARTASGIVASRVPQQKRNYFFRIGYDLR